MANIVERQFRVRVIAMSLKNNGIAKSKEIVKESQLAAPVSELLAGKYIEEYFEDATDVKHKVVETKMNDISDAVPGGKAKESKPKK